jgi:hypothetical protein
VSERVGGCTVQAFFSSDGVGVWSAAMRRERVSEWASVGLRKPDGSCTTRVNRARNHVLVWQQPHLRGNEVRLHEAWLGQAWKRNDSVQLVQAHLRKRW